MKERPSGGGGPDLSVILITDGIEAAAETISHLGAQTAAPRIELVLATPGGSLGHERAQGLDGLHSVQAIDCDPRLGTAVARAATVVHARAPVVVLAETHCFPEPDWAEALIEAHRGPWAGVGPEIGNENPGSSVSWGCLLVDYGSWVAPADRGPADDIPGHNSSYKRDLLLSYGDDLARLFESESILHWDLRARGHRLYVESHARTHHRNINRWIPALLEHFHNGRTFGSLRSRRWSRARRLLYAAGSPLIPVLRLGRILRRLRRIERTDLLPDVLPPIVGSLVAHAAGELTGYLAGSGRAVQAMAKYEINRDFYVAELQPSHDCGAQHGAAGA